MLDGATDPGEDELHLATLFLLSPVGETNPRPGPHWSPVVRHHQWWDLSHATRLQNRPLAPFRLTFNAGPLAGGTAQPAIDAVLEDLAQRDQQAALFLSRVRAEGHLWTI